VGRADIIHGIGHDHLVQGLQGRPQGQKTQTIVVAQRSGAHESGQPCRYATSGLFIGQAYFDLYYAIIAIIVVSDSILTQELKKLSEDEGKEKTPSPVVTPNRSWQAYGGPRRQPPRRPS
jgi:hypothetical protein